MTSDYISRKRSLVREAEQKPAGRKVAPNHRERSIVPVQTEIIRNDQRENPSGGGGTERQREQELTGTGRSCS